MSFMQPCLILEAFRADEPMDGFDPTAVRVAFGQASSRQRTKGHRMSGGTFVAAALDRQLRRLPSKVRNQFDRTSRPAHTTASHARCGARSAPTYGRGAGPKPHPTIPDKWSGRTPRSRRKILHREMVAASQFFFFFMNQNVDHLARHLLE